MTVSDIIIISFYYIYANVCRDLSNKSNGMCIISHDIRVQRVNHNDLEIGQNLHKIIYYTTCTPKYGRSTHPRHAQNAKSNNLIFRIVICT